MELRAHDPGPVDAGAGIRAHRWSRATGGRSQLARTSWPAHPDGGPGNSVTRSELENLWDRHGGSGYALACALLGDQAAAVEAVRRAMADLTCSVRGVSTEEAGRCLARHVYRHAHEAAGGTPDAVLLPPVMVWVSQLAWLQRASLALCMFGGLTHRDAADLLDVPPSTVADLLTAGLRELGRLAADSTATRA